MLLTDYITQRRKKTKQSKVKQKPKETKQANKNATM